MATSLYRDLHPHNRAHAGARIGAAAAVFTGNTIARLRPDAHWTAYEGGSALVGNRQTQFEVSRLLEGLRDADDESVRELLSMLSDWAQETVDSAAVRPEPVRPPAGQVRYVRPPLPTTSAADVRVDRVPRCPDPRRCVA